MKLVLRQEAEADILAAFRWYESKRDGLGDKFLDAVDAAFAQVTDAPTSFPIVYRDLRRAVVRKFPYLVYFRGADDVVQVFAVLHGKRDRELLRDRALT